jgi:hypothetical protein
MNRIFYIEINGAASEPLSFEELITKEFTSDTLICEKFGDWKPAKDYPELTNFIKWQPSSPTGHIQTKENENNKLQRYLIIGFSAILLFAFFMPWLKLIIGFSAKDIVLGDVSEFVNHKGKYLLLLFPFVGITLGLLFLNTESIKYGMTKILTIIPLLTICYTSIYTYLVMQSGLGLQSNSFIGYFDIGFWLTFMASLFIPLIASKIYNRANQYLQFISLIIFTSLILLWIINNKLAQFLAFLTNTLGILIILTILIVYIWLFIKLLNNILKS